MKCLKNASVRWWCCEGNLSLCKAGESTRDIFHKESKCNAFLCYTDTSLPICCHACGCWLTPGREFNIQDHEELVCLTARSDQTEHQWIVCCYTAQRILSTEAKATLCWTWNGAFQAVLHCAYMCASLWGICSSPFLMVNVSAVWRRSDTGDELMSLFPITVYSESRSFCS